MLCHFVTLQCSSLLWNISLFSLCQIYFLLVIAYLNYFWKKPDPCSTFVALSALSCLLAQDLLSFILFFCGLRIEAETPAVFGNHSFFGRQENVDGCWCWQCYANIHFCKFAYGLSITVVARYYHKKVTAQFSWVGCKMQGFFFPSSMKIVES